MELIKEDIDFTKDNFKIYGCSGYVFVEMFRQGILIHIYYQTDTDGNLIKYDPNKLPREERDKAIMRMYDDGLQQIIIGKVLRLRPSRVNQIIKSNQT